MKSIINPTYAIPFNLVIFLSDHRDIPSMAKCPSPFSEKAQAAMDYIKKLQEEEEEEVVKATTTMERLALEEEEKRKRHRPLEEHPKGTVSDAWIEKTLTKHGKLPQGICINDRILPKIEVLYEACFFSIHNIKRCYPSLALALAFEKETPADEIPLDRFFPEHFIEVYPDRRAGKTMYLTPEHEKDLSNKLTSEQLQYVKDCFTAAKPRTDDDVRDAGQLLLAQHECPNPSIVRDGWNGPIASLRCLLFENARPVHGKLVVKWLVQHLLAALPPRPTPDAAIEYCIQTAPRHANAYIVYLRWCTLEDGMKRYGEGPLPCKKFDHEILS
jgi:hypothetical protein